MARRTLGSHALQLRAALLRRWLLFLTKSNIWIIIAGALIVKAAFAEVENSSNRSSFDHFVQAVHSIGAR